MATTSWEEHVSVTDPIPAQDVEDRWTGVQSPYAPADVEKLRGSVQVEHRLARLGAERLWKLLHERSCVAALGASTGNQAVQQVCAGLAVQHQQEVGASYFEEVAMAVTGGDADTTALSGSTEESQFSN